MDGEHEGVNYFKKPDKGMTNYVIVEEQLAS